MNLHTLIPCLFLLMSRWLVGAEAPQWGRIMVERFETPAQNRHHLSVLPPPLGATLSEGRMSYDEDRHAQSLSGRMAMVCAAAAGPHVEVKVQFRFTAPAKDEPGDMATALMLSFADTTVAGIEVLRAKTPDETTRIQFVEERAGKSSPTVIREFSLPGLAPDGMWLLRCQYGHLTLEVNEKVIGSAYCEGLFQPLQALIWSQKGGEAACSEIVVEGDVYTPSLASDLTTLKKAKRLNEEAKALLGDNHVQEALAKMRESLALFVSVHGENHPDPANAHANLGTILEKAGDFAEANRCWNKAIAINETVLGAGHPNTTTARFNLGRLEFEYGSKAAARELWTRCHDDWRSSMGPDFPLVKNLAEILKASF